MRLGIGVYAGRILLKATWSSLSLLGVHGMYDEHSYAAPKPWFLGLKPYLKTLTPWNPFLFQASILPHPSFETLIFKILILDLYNFLVPRGRMGSSSLWIVVARAGRLRIIIIFSSSGGIKLQTLWLFSVDLVLVCVLSMFWSHGLDLVSRSHSRTFKHHF